MSEKASSPNGNIPMYSMNDINRVDQIEVNSTCSSTVFIWCCRCVMFQFKKDLLDYTLLIIFAADTFTSLASMPMIMECSLFVSVVLNFVKYIAVFSVIIFAVCCDSLATSHY